MLIDKNQAWVFSDNSRTFTGLGHSSEKDTYFIIFPHAGGSPSYYRHWTQYLPKNFECWIVLMPGRESRFNEAPHKNTQVAVEEIYQSFIQMPKKSKLVVYGHSLGSMLAFTFILRLQIRFRYSSTLLAVSGRSEPQINNDKLNQIMTLDNIAFLKKVADDYGGFDREILNNYDYISLLAPILRADMEISSSYKLGLQNKVHCPIIAFGGNQDEGATANDMIKWQQYTTGSLSIKSCIGGHFFIADNAEYIINQILECNIKA